MLSEGIPVTASNSDGISVCASRTGFWRMSRPLRNIQPTDMSQLQVGMTQILFSPNVFEAATST